MHLKESRGCESKITQKTHKKVREKKHNPMPEFFGVQNKGFFNFISKKASDTDGASRMPDISM